MRQLHNPSLDPYFNMAFDSYVLENTDFEGFYLWQNSPSVIIGLNQNIFAEVNLPYLREKGILPVRRVSGGGAVYHDLGNVNYTFTGKGNAVEDAPEVIVAALEKMGVPARLSGRNDIMVDGRKCSGFAKRLACGRTMVHGTLMFNVNLEDLTAALAVPGSKLSKSGVESVRSRVANLRDYLPQGSVEDFIRSLGSILSGGEGSASLSDEEILRIDKLSREKFRSWDWIYGHSPRGEFKVSRKFSCGTVTAHYTLCRGRFEEISFTGDFIGKKPADEFAKKIKGLRIEDLSSVNAGEYFDSLDDITPLFFA